MNQCTVCLLQNLALQTARSNQHVTEQAKVCSEANSHYQPKYQTKTKLRTTRNKQKRTLKIQTKIDINAEYSNKLYTRHWHTEQKRHIQHTTNCTTVH